MTRSGADPSEGAAATDVRIVGEGDRHLLRSVAEGVFDRPVDDTLLAEFLGDPRHHLAVAVDDDTVVGMASALHYIHPDKPAELWINEVGVADAARARGLGGRLVQALLDHGRLLGCGGAWVLTEPDNEAARALYTGRGGRPQSAVLFEWSLADAPPT